MISPALTTKDAAVLIHALGLTPDASGDLWRGDEKFTRDTDYRFILRCPVSGAAYSVSRAVVSKVHRRRQPLGERFELPPDCLPVSAGWSVNPSSFYSRDPIYGWSPRGRCPEPALNELSAMLCAYRETLPPIVPPDDDILKDLEDRGFEFRDTGTPYRKESGRRVGTTGPYFRFSSHSHDRLTRLQIREALADRGVVILPHPHAVSLAPMAPRHAATPNGFMKMSDEGWYTPARILPPVAYSAAKMLDSIGELR